MSPIFNYLIAFFEHTFFIGRYLKHIHSFVKACVSINICSKTNANSLQIIYQFVFWKVFGSIKTHVFGKMG